MPKLVMFGRHKVNWKFNFHVYIHIPTFFSCVKFSRNKWHLFSSLRFCPNRASPFFFYSCWSGSVIVEQMQKCAKDTFCTWEKQPKWRYMGKLHLLCVSRLETNDLIFKTKSTFIKLCPHQKNSTGCINHKWKTNILSLQIQNTSQPKISHCCVLTTTHQSETCGASTISSLSRCVGDLA